MTANVRLRAVDIYGKEGDSYARGELKFFGALNPLQEKRQFDAYLDPVEREDWVVYAKAPFAGPEQVLDYVGRYTHRVAISNNRLEKLEDGKVTFRWKDYRNGSSQKTMTLTADEFIRRFLLHALPLGFHRIRYYGFMSNCHRQQKLEQCRMLLNMAPLPVNEMQAQSRQPRPEPPFRSRSATPATASIRLARVNWTWT